MTDTETLIERVIVAFTLAHFGHSGIPGAPDDSCPRCNAERALDSLAAALAAEKERADDAEKRQMRSGAAAKDNWDAAFIARQRAEAAEAQVAALRKALTEISDKEDR